MSYAASTEVPADRSRAEIEKTLTRYGATSFAYGWRGQVATIAFEIAGRQVRMSVPLPDMMDEAFATTPTRGTQRTGAARRKLWEQAVRQKWRALALVVKAKLEAVDAGITTVEQEFLAHILLPSGATVHQHTQGAIDEAYRTGRFPELMAGGGR